jgi:hypothetical protein
MGSGVETPGQGQDLAANVAAMGKEARFEERKGNKNEWFFQYSNS